MWREWITFIARAGWASRWLFTVIPARRNRSTSRTSSFPRELRLAATAVVQPGGGLENGQWRQHPPTLTLVDPFQERSVSIGGRTAGLASDKTTPMAMQVARGQLAALEWTGLFASNCQAPRDRGRPVHASPLVSLARSRWCSSTGWRPVPGRGFKRLTSFKTIRKSRRIINSGCSSIRRASRFRDLPRNCVTVAHQGADRGLRSHEFQNRIARPDTSCWPESMGGLLSKMMVQDSRLGPMGRHDTRCTATGSKPEPRSNNHSTTSLSSALPHVKRVVFIATPHRGSPGSPIADSARRSRRLCVRTRGCRRPYQRGSEAL